MGPTKGVRSGGSACGPRSDATRNRSAGDRNARSADSGPVDSTTTSPHPRGTSAALGSGFAPPGFGGGGGCIPGLWRRRRRRRREVSGSGLWRRELSGSGHQQRKLSGSGLRIPESVTPPPPGALLRIPKEGSAATGSGEGSSAAPGSDGRVTHRTSPARRRLSQGCCHSPTLS